MPNRLNFLHKSHSTPVNAETGRSAGTITANWARSTTVNSQQQQRLKDPNCVDRHLVLNQKCIYERSLPGESYITAHISRLQDGYYDSPMVHGDRIENVRFIAIRFVFHPNDTRHRFVSARITLALHDKEPHPRGVPLPPQLNHPNNSKLDVDVVAEALRKPRFLRHAPRLLYGSMSPETLDWTFNMAGSLGVSQGPASASINPEYGLKSSYKVYKMMKIQGSVRSLYSWYGHKHDVEDGELVWTLEENSLQKSGLPREFTFVVMLTKGDATDVAFDIEVDPVVGSWYGTYPKWWLNRIWFQPMYKEPIDLDLEVGQKFTPSTKSEGFNFASLMGNFDDFVSLPGTMYTKSEPVPPDAVAAASDDGGATPPKQQRTITASPVPADDSRNVNINLFLKGYQNENSLSSTATPNTIQEHSASPLPETGFSISRNRNHRRRHSEVPLTPSQPVQVTSNSRRRPVSAIYETSIISPPLPNDAPLSNDAQKHRRMSSHTDGSDDLFTDPYVTNTPKTPLHQSRSLRHSRSRSGLQHEYDESSSAHDSTPEQTRGGVHSSGRRDSDHTPSSDLRDSFDRRLSVQLPPAVPMISTTPTNQPPFTSPRKRHSLPARHSRNATVNSTILQEDDPSLQYPPTSQRFSATSDSTTVADHSPFVPSFVIPSFPPSSYPAYAPQRATSLDSSEDDYDGFENITYVPARRTVSSSASTAVEGVDDIVQREISNYFKTHPELYSHADFLDNGMMTVKDGYGITGNDKTMAPPSKRSLKLSADAGRRGLGGDNHQAANRGGGGGVDLGDKQKRVASPSLNGNYVKPGDKRLASGGWEYLE